MHVAALIVVALFLLAVLAHGAWSVISPARAMEWSARHYVAVELVNLGSKDAPWNKAGSRVFGLVSCGFALLVLAFVIRALVSALGIK
ncbi:MAG TPA: hypothetical protein VKT72_04125 [Candidatus Baltobacteraceae bacterium]|nr:hypothetical protein [Candidatus Baltobacteraceae bacterium]